MKFERKIKMISNKKTAIKRTMIKFEKKIIEGGN